MRQTHACSSTAKVGHSAHRLRLAPSLLDPLGSVEAKHTGSGLADVGTGVHRQRLGAQVVGPAARAVRLPLEREHSQEVVIEAARDQRCPRHARCFQVLLCRTARTDQLDVWLAVLQVLGLGY